MLIQSLLETALRQGWEHTAAVPLAKLTTFKIGGALALLLRAGTEPQLCDMIAACRREEIPLLFLGGGSNLLAPDEGIEAAAVTLSPGLWGLQAEGELIRCGAGVRLSVLADFAQKQGLAGAEFLHGIPGTAGGAALMNAGAYGGEMADILVSCRHADREGRIGTLTAAEMELGYRTSVYKTNGCCITQLTLKLSPGDRPAIAARMAELMAARKAKQPLEVPSAGSVFKRPPGQFAGTLIERCGLKGAREGGAQVSPKHAGFIVNTGGATAADVRVLIERVRRTVREQTGFDLECEIRFLDSRGQPV